MRSTRSLIVFLFGVLSFASNAGHFGALATAADYDPSVVVARLADTALTLGDLRREIEARRLYRTTPESDAKRRRDLLQELIDEELVRAEAHSVSLKNAYASRARIRRDEVLTAVQLFSKEVVLPALKLDSATIDTFYHNHIGRYSIDRDQRRARVISVWKEGRSTQDGKPVRHDSLYSGWYPEDKIDSLYIRLSEGEDFSELARRHSEDPASRGKGGDLGWLSSRAVGGGIFAEKVMNQPLYLISKPIETDAAWHIVQVTGERKVGPVPLDMEISADIVTNLVQQQKEKILTEIGDSLLAAADIDWNDDCLWLPHEKLTATQILAVVNSRDTVLAGEFLIDGERWKDPATRMPPSPERRADILRNEYVRQLCWLGFLRERGYTAREEVTAEVQRSEQSEREAVVFQRVYSPQIPEADSSAIERYYRDSIHLFGSEPEALSRNWQAIKMRLANENRERAIQRWRQTAASRHGLTRYDDRLDSLPLLERREQKKK